MPRKQLKTDAETLLPYLSQTPADDATLLMDLGWTPERLGDACYAIRQMGIRLDTRRNRIRVLTSSWPLCEQKALEAYED